MGEYGSYGFDPSYPVPSGGTYQDIPIQSDTPPAADSPPSVIAADDDRQHRQPTRTHSDIGTGRINRAGGGPSILQGGHDRFAQSTVDFRGTQGGAGSSGGGATGGRSGGRKS